MSLLTLPWRQFVEELQASEDEQLVWDALEAERRAGKRAAVMLRIYQRASKLRRQREHSELLGLTP